MKANAPEKLYIFNPEKRVVWFSKTSDKQVEYARTDAFIEKALRWMMSTGGVNDVLSGEMIEDFKNHMKGE